MKPALLAIAAVLAASSDFDLVARDAGGRVVEHVCAKSQASCELAADAVHEGRWAPELRALDLRCEPHPDCFEPRSLCIETYNCPAGGR